MYCILWWLVCLPQCQLQGIHAGGGLWVQHLLTAGGRRTEKTFCLLPTSLIFHLITPLCHFFSLLISSLYQTHHVLSSLLHPISSQRHIICNGSKAKLLQEAGDLTNCHNKKQWVDLNGSKFSMDVKKIPKSVHSKSYSNSFCRNGVYDTFELLLTFN